MNFLKINSFNRIGLLLLLTGNLVACGSDSSKKSSVVNPAAREAEVINSMTHQDGPVVIFGDSVANGRGATSEDSDLSGCMSGFTNKDVIKIAVDGSTSRTMLPRAYEAEQIQPSLVIMSLGGNDVLEDAYQRNFPASETYQHMECIFNLLISSNSLVLYIGQTPPKALADAAGMDPSRLVVVNQIATEQGAVVIENGFEDMWGNSVYMADNLHPNDKGYARLCARVKNSLKPHFKYVQ